MPTPSISTSSCFSYTTPECGRTDLPDPKRKFNINDYNIEDIFKKPRQVDSTQTQYDVCLKKFLDFILKDFTNMCPTVFNETNIAIYLMHLSESNAWKQRVLTLAAEALKGLFRVCDECAGRARAADEK